MRIAMLAAALLASSALVRMLPDDMGGSGGGGGAAAPETAPPNAGGPGAVAPAAPAPTQEPAPPVDNAHVADGAQKFTSTEVEMNKAAPKISAGRFVTLSLDENSDATVDGEKTCVGLVTKLLDDGSVNVRAFAGNGGSDVNFTGVRNKTEVDAMPDGADKNAARAAVWDWPARV